MILRPAGHGGVVNPLSFGEERRKLPLWMLGAIGASIALHMAGAAWIYNQRFVLPTEDTPRDPFDVTIWQPPKPKPPVAAETPPKPTTTLPVHQTTTPPVTTIEAPFQSNPTDLTGNDPPVIGQTNVVETTPTGPGEITAPAVIRNPAWLSKPTAAQMERVYPHRAAEDGIGGRVELRCAVTVGGTLTGCAVASETPAGAGFGAAAMKLTKYFRMSPRTVDGRPVEGALVNIPLRFSAE
jgi:protein TonB